MIRNPQFILIIRDTETRCCILINGIVLMDECDSGDKTGSPLVGGLTFASPTHMLKC